MLRQEQAEAQPEIERGRRQSAGRERESDGGRGRESEREGAQQAHGFCLPREISKWQFTYICKHLFYALAGKAFADEDDDDEMADIRR